MCAHSTVGLIKVSWLVSVTGVKTNEEAYESDVIKSSMLYTEFLNPYCTPQSKAAFKVRIFLAGVSIRAIISRTIEIAIATL